MRQSTKPRFSELRPDRPHSRMHKKGPPSTALVYWGGGQVGVLSGEKIDVVTALRSCGRGGCVASRIQSHRCRPAAPYRS